MSGGKKMAPRLASFTHSIGGEFIKKVKWKKSPRVHNARQIENSENTLLINFFGLEKYTITPITIVPTKETTEDRNCQLVK